MILVDTSCWIEFLRETNSPADLRLTELVDADGTLACTDAVVMEILAGARDEREEERLRDMLHTHEFLPTAGPDDYEAAAAVYRRCRRGGETIRSLVDCLIAAVALRCDADVLHADGDFDAIARHTALRVA